MLSFVCAFLNDVLFMFCFVGGVCSRVCFLPAVVWYWHLLALIGCVCGCMCA